MDPFYKIISWLMAVTFSFLSALGGLIPQREAKDFRVSAYIVTYSLDNIRALDVSHLNEVTDVILLGSLAGINTDGSVNTSRDFPDIISLLREKIGERDIKIHLNLGVPYGSGATFEENMDSHAEQFRKAIDSGVLETNIKALLDGYGLDGVSFDYEFPIREAHYRMFGDFLVSLDKVLDSDQYISCALSYGYAALPQDAIDVIDRVELMVYDLWDRTGRHSTFGIAKGAVDEMERLGYSREQIDLGLPFYARPTTQEAYWYDYKDYADKMDMIGLAEDENTGLTASFNTPDIIYAKTKWSIDKGLGGVMIWHYAADVPADNAKSLFGAVTRAKFN